jgi:hypothetical protein
MSLFDGVDVVFYQVCSMLQFDDPDGNEIVALVPPA